MVVNRPTEDPKWAEGTPPAIPDTNPPTDPGPTRRSSGYGYEERLPHESFNWIIRNLGRWADYLGRSAGGGFSSLPELIDTLEPGETAVYTPEELRPQQVRLLTRPSSAEVLKVASDGKYLYFVEKRSASDLRLYSFDLRTNTFRLMYRDTSTDINLTLPVELGVNGKYICLGYTHLPDRAQVLVFDKPDIVDQSPVRTHLSIPIQTDVYVAGLALAGERLYVTFDFAGASFQVTQSHLYTSSGFDFINGINLFVRATNGDVVVFSGGSGTISVYDMELTGELWSASLGTSGSGPTPSIQATNKHIYVLDGGGNLQVIPSSPISSGAGFATLVKPGSGRLVVDSESILVQPYAAATLLEIDEASSSRVFPLMEVMRDLDTLQPIVDIASDGAYVYVVGKTSSGGDYGIWQIAKAVKPKVWRRLDPDSDESWTRTLAAPI